MVTWLLKDLPEVRNKNSHETIQEIKESSSPFPRTNVWSTRHECVYKIPCHNCSSTYIGETGRSYGKRQEEHRKEVESISNRTLTWADWKDVAGGTNKSAITDHVAKENHVVDWSGAKILDREGHRRTRQLQSLQPSNVLWPYYGQVLISKVRWPYAWQTKRRN